MIRTTEDGAQKYVGSCKLFTLDEWLANYS
jgi:hypothetical protein